MSIDALQWAFKMQIRPATVKIVLIALGDYASDDNTCWPSIETLENKTSLDRKTILKALSLLKDAGLIRDTGERKGTTKSIPVYVLSLGMAFDGTVRANPREAVPKKVHHKRDTLDTGSSTVFPEKQSQISVEAVPFFRGSSTVFGTQNPQGNLMEPPREPPDDRARVLDAEFVEVTVVSDGQGRRRPDQSKARFVRDTLAEHPEWCEELAEIESREVRHNPTGFRAFVLDEWLRLGPPSTRQKILPPPRQIASRASPVVMTEGQRKMAEGQAAIDRSEAAAREHFRRQMQKGE